MAVLDALERRERALRLANQAREGTCVDETVAVPLLVATRRADRQQDAEQDMTGPVFASRRGTQSMCRGRGGWWTSWGCGPYAAPVLEDKHTPEQGRRPPPRRLCQQPPPAPRQLSTTARHARSGALVRSYGTAGPVARIAFAQRLLTNRSWARYFRGVPARAGHA